MAPRRARRSSTRRRPRAARPAAARPHDERAGLDIERRDLQRPIGPGLVAGEVSSQLRPPPATGHQCRAGTRQPARVRARTRRRAAGRRRSGRPRCAPADVPTIRSGRVRSDTARRAARRAAPSATPAPDVPAAAQHQRPGHVPPQPADRRHHEARHEDAAEDPLVVGGEPQRQVDVEVVAPIVGVTRGEIGQRTAHAVDRQHATSTSMTRGEHGDPGEAVLPREHGNGEDDGHEHRPDGGVQELDGAQRRRRRRRPSPWPSAALDRQAARRPVAPRPDVVGRRRARRTARRSRARSSAGRSGNRSRRGIQVPRPPRERAR